MNKPIPEPTDPVDPFDYDPDLLDMSEPPITEGEWLESLRPLEPEDDPDYDPDQDNHDGDVTDTGTGTGTAGLAPGTDVDARFWSIVVTEQMNTPAPVEPVRTSIAEGTAGFPAPGSRWFGRPDQPVTIGEALDMLMLGFYGHEPPDRLNLAQMVQVAAELWDNEEVCEVFTNQFESTCVLITGTLAYDYPTPVALRIIETFSRTWTGCPDQDRD